MKRLSIIGLLMALLLIVLLTPGCGSRLPPIRLAGGAHATDPTAAEPWAHYLLLFMVAESQSAEIAAFAVLCSSL